MSAPDRDQYQRPPWDWGAGIFAGGITAALLYLVGWVAAVQIFAGEGPLIAMRYARGWITDHQSMSRALLSSWRYYHYYRSAGTLGSAWHYLAIWVVGWGVTILSLAVIPVLAYFAAQPNNPTGVRHLRGPRLIEATPKVEGDGLQFLPKWYFRFRDEVAHGLFLGSSGSGKTTLLWKIINGARARGDRLLLSDAKGDFVQGLDRAIIFAPWDRRSHRWAIGRDLDNEMQLTEWATQTIPTPKSGDPVWAQAAQSILIAALMQIRSERGSDWFLADLRQNILALLADGRRIQRAILDFLPEAAGIVQDVRGKTFASIMMNLSASMRALLLLCKLDERLAAAGAPKLSLRAWAERQGAMPLVLVHHQQAASMTKAWCAGVLDYIVSHYADRPDCLPNVNRTWFILDEFPQLGRVESAIRGLEILRSKGVRIWLGIQSPAQLVHTYSQELWQVVADNTAWKFITRIQGDESADWAERMAGRRTIERYSRTRQAGAVTEAWNRSTEPVMPAEEFRTRLSPDQRGVFALGLLPGRPDVHLFHAAYEKLRRYRKPRDFWPAVEMNAAVDEIDTHRLELAGQAEAPAVAPSTSSLDLTSWIQERMAMAEPGPEARTVGLPGGRPAQALEEVVVEGAGAEEAREDGPGDEAGVVIAEHLADALLPGVGLLVKGIGMADELQPGGADAAASAAGPAAVAGADSDSDPFTLLAKRARPRTAALEEGEEED